MAVSFSFEVKKWYMNEEGHASLALIGLSNPKRSILEAANARAMKEASKVVKLREKITREEHQRRLVQAVSEARKEKVSEERRLQRKRAREDWAKESYQREAKKAKVERRRLRLTWEPSSMTCMQRLCRN